MVDELKKFRDPREMVTKDIKRQAFIPDEVLLELDLQNKEPNNNSCFIESLTELAWLDPFP